MLLLEIFGVATGLLCVWFLVKQNIWTWPLGIANNLAYIVVFFASKLYADMGLQFFYIAIAIYGWWSWRRATRDRHAMPVRHLNPQLAVALGFATALSTYGIYSLLRTATDSNVPFWDALTTSLSLCAQFLQSRKWIENWYVWIAADVFYIGLYISKGLYATTFLYAIFMALCVLGLMEWRKSLAAQTSRSALEPAAIS